MTTEVVVWKNGAAGQLKPDGEKPFKAESVHYFTCASLKFFNIEQFFQYFYDIKVLRRKSVSCVLDEWTTDSV